MLRAIIPISMSVIQHSVLQKFQSLMKKKVFFSVLLAAMFVAAVSVFTSCDQKKEVKKIGEYELTEQNDKFGLKDGTHVLLDPEYDKIAEAPEYAAIFAEKGNETTVVSNGYAAFSAVIDSIVPATGDFFYVYSPDKMRLWQKGTSYVVGPFTGVKLIDNIVFLNDDGKWGAATTDHTGLAPRKFDKVFIVKNGTDTAVLVKDKSGWMLYDKDGVSDGQRYDIPPKTLEKQVKSLKLTGDVGIIGVKWAL